MGDFDGSAESRRTMSVVLRSENLPVAGVLVNGFNGSLRNLQQDENVYLDTADNELGRGSDRPYSTVENLGNSNSFEGSSGGIGGQVSASGSAVLVPNLRSPSMSMRLGVSTVVSNIRPNLAHNLIQASSGIGPSGRDSSSSSSPRVGSSSEGNQDASQDHPLRAQVRSGSALSSSLSSRSPSSASASSIAFNGPQPNRGTGIADVSVPTADRIPVSPQSVDSSTVVPSSGSDQNSESEFSVGNQPSDDDSASLVDVPVAAGVPDFPLREDNSDASSNNSAFVPSSGSDLSADSNYSDGSESSASSSSEDDSMVDEAEALVPHGYDLLDQEGVCDLVAYFNTPIYLMHNKEKVTLAVLVKKLMVVAVEDEDRRDKAISGLLLAPGLFQASKRHDRANHLANFRNFLSSNRPENEMLAFAVDLREHMGVKKRVLMSKVDVAGANVKMEKLIRDGQLSKAQAVCDSIDVEPSVLSDQEKQDKVKRLHPEATVDDVLELSQGADQSDLTALEVYDALLKAPKVSAAGVSGFTFAFLLTIFAGKGFAPTTECLGPLINFLNLALKGNISAFALGLLIAGRLVLLPKPDGGIRPVNVGEALLRLIGRIINVREAARASNGFSPHQLAVGISGAGEKMARVTQAAFDSGLGILAADAPNAFNNIRRRYVQDGLRIMAPTVESWFVRTHTGQATLRDSSGRRIFQSSTGVRQGDPLGMLFYSAAIHRGLVQVSDHMRVTYPDTVGLTETRGVGYADDLAIMGEVDHLIAQTDEIKRILDTVGYSMSVPKSRILCRDATDAQIESSTIGITKAHRIMGVPIGSEEDVKRMASQTVIDAGLSFVNLEKVASRQTALALTTYCVNTRPTYLTRAVHPSLLQEALISFDDSVDKFVGKLAGAALSVDAKAIRGLPIGLGGMSIHRHAGPKSHFAYLSGRALSANYLETHYDFDVVDGSLSSLPVPESYSHLGVLQPPSRDIKSAQNIILGGLVRNLAASGEDDKAAWLLSGSKPTTESDNTTCSGWWCLWSGGTDPRRAFQNHVLQGAIRQRLLLPSLPAGTHCAIGRHEGRDSALHPLHCPTLWNGLGTLRHNAVRDALFTLIKECLEPRAADLILEYQVPNTERRADILLKVRAHAGQPATTYLIDVTVTSPACEDALEKGAQREPMVAANLAEEKKIRDYQPLYADRHISPSCIVVPFAVEANGRLGASAASWIDRITKGGVVEHPAAKRALFAKTCSFAIAKYGSLMAWSNAEAAHRVGPPPH